MLLEVVGLSVSYDRASVLSDVSFSMEEGELVTLVGPNGAGKTTVLRAISGLVRWDKDTLRSSSAGRITLEGSVTFAGERIDRLQAHDIVKRGLIHCPERRRPFREMTVSENLLAGAYLVSDGRHQKRNLEKVYELFPVLKARGRQIAGTLSGGEQQMLAIGRALMLEPRLLCIDEPSNGLAPGVKRDVFERVAAIGRSGVTVLLVEQDVAAAFELARRSYVLSQGRVVASGTCAVVMQQESIRKTYLGL